MRVSASFPFAAALAVAALSLVAFPGTPSIAAPADEAEAKTVLEHLKAEIEAVRPQLINAGAKIRGGVVMMDLSSDGTITPGRRCCERNIVKLEQRFREISLVWGELVECYRAEGNTEAEIQANFVRDEAISLVRALGAFAQSPTEQGSAGGYQAMVSAFKRIEGASAKLVECGEPRVRARAQ